LSKFDIATTWITLTSVTLHPKSELIKFTLPVREVVTKGWGSYLPSFIFDLVDLFLFDKIFKIKISLFLII